MENYQGLYGIIQKNASNFQVAVTTSPPQRTKPGPSQDTNVSTQAVSTLLENGFAVFTGRKSFVGCGRLKEGRDPWPDQFDLVRDRGKHND